MAREVARVGRAFFVQTPDRRFPVEPHLLTPFIHYLPRHVQYHLIRNVTVWGLLTRPSVQRSEAFLREIRLLSRQELQLLFPDAVIFSERFLGMSKSLVAFRHLKESP